MREAWRIAYTDRAGKRRFEQRRTKRDADARRIEIESELSRGIHTPDAASITVAEGCGVWVRKGETEGLEWGTLKQRRELCRNHIEPLLGKEKLSRLTTPRVELFRDQLVETRSRPMAGKVVRALSSMLIEAMRQGLVAQNVAHNVKVKNAGRDQAPVDIPDTTALKSILAAALRLANEKPEAHPMALLVVSAGLRGSELRGLRWPDFDLKAGTVTIRQRADQRGMIGKCKSKAAYRSVPLAPAVVSVFKAWKLRCPPSPLDLVFPNGKGKPIHVNNLRDYWWQPILIAVGYATATGEKDSKKRDMYVLKYRMHDLRHARASRWIKQKINLKRLTTWLGHSSVQITLDIYGHLIKDENEDAAIVAAANAELIA